MTNLGLDKEIRACYNNESVRVYQAYSDKIADTALKAQTFQPPSFKMGRMTWIKPSFLWMMYRAGWGLKDEQQKRILAIDITLDGFFWALENSCLSHYDASIYPSIADWTTRKRIEPVVIQWDPERNIFLEKLTQRAIQIGLSGEAVERYTSDWIIKISEVTETAREINKLISSGYIEQAQALLPVEKSLLISKHISQIIGAS